MKEFTIEMAQETFKNKWIMEDYERYIDEIIDLEESLDKVYTPYAILSWWWLKERILKLSAQISGDCQMEYIMLAAVLENEVETVLHEHFTDDVIAEYRKKVYIR